jgi:hypothetical protein
VQPSRNCLARVTRQAFCISYAERAEHGGENGTPVQRERLEALPTQEVGKLQDSHPLVPDEGGPDLELAKWLAPRVAWQRRLLELSRTAEAAISSAECVEPETATPVHVRAERPVPPVRTPVLAVGR